MHGEERRKEIMKIIRKTDHPVSGSYLAEKMHVSRQVIVQDIALLRANGAEIDSTNRGYIIRDTERAVRVFKVSHRDEEVEEELSMIVDLGGRVEDVFIYHKVYGVMRGVLNIRSRLDVQKYMDGIRSGKSSLLKNITSGYHYHTVSAASEQILDMIQDALGKRGFLAKLKDYEPVNFWKE